MILGVDHFTINITDVEKTIFFYKGILGLRQLETINMGDHELIYFYLSKDTKLELIRYFYETEEYHLKENARGIYRHMALKTDNLSDIYKKCIENNVCIKLKPTNMEKLKCKGMLIEDSNGVEIEIVEKMNTLGK